MKKEKKNLITAHKPLKFNFKHTICTMIQRKAKALHIQQKIFWMHIKHYREIPETMLDNLRRPADRNLWTEFISKYR